MAIMHTCRGCGKDFSHPSSKAKACSKACSYASRKAETPETRFDAKVNRDGPTPTHVPELGPCWIWTGAKNPGGYGRFNALGRRGRRCVVLAHRWAWQRSIGAPTNAMVLHACDNPACVRVDHLFLGDAAANAADMVSKGRHVKSIPAMQGERHWAAKLTAADVRLIRSSSMPRRGLANRYGVSVATIEHIIHRKSWKHVA